MADFSYSPDLAARVDVFAPRAQEVFPGCYATGDTRRLEERKADLEAALAAGDFERFREAVQRCDGSWWGWVARDGRFLCFTNRWGAAKAFVGARPGGGLAVFESFDDVEGVVPLRTTLPKIATYLAFSYVPGNDTLFEGVHNVPPGVLYELCGTEWRMRGKNDTFLGRPEPMDLDEASRLLAEALHRSVERCLEGVGDFHLMLSGGFDSRTVLSAALESKRASDIHTFTFGYPGSFDYELGNRLAKAAGTRHRSSPLSIADYTLADVRAAARDCLGQMFSSVEMPLKFTEPLRQSGLPVVTGFMGDALSGKRLEQQFLDRGANVEGWEEEVFDYEVMTPPEALMPLFRNAPFDAAELRRRLVARYLTAEPFAGYSDYANLHDQWDYYNRQRNHDFYANSKASGRGLRYRYPIISWEVTEVYRRIPSAHRYHGMVYRKAVSERYPALFSLPMTSYHGGRVKWRGDTRLRHYVHAALFALRHRLLRGRFDLDCNVSYLPFWKHFNEDWEGVRFALEQEERWAFLDFDQVRRDLSFLKAHRFYAYKKGPQYARVLGVLNLLIVLDALGAEVAEE